MVRACRCIPCNGNGARGWPRYGPDEAGTECLECPGVPNGGNVTDNGSDNRSVCIPGPGAWWLYWLTLQSVSLEAYMQTPWGRLYHRDSCVCAGLEGCSLLATCRSTALMCPTL